MIDNFEHVLVSITQLCKPIPQRGFHEVHPNLRPQPGSQNCPLVRVQMQFDYS